MEANNDEVICPACVHQFRAIPVNVQAEIAALRSERDALAAKLVPLKADAERYRWIVKQDHKDRQGVDTYDEFKAARDKRIDAAIDAAKGGQHEDA